MGETQTSFRKKILNEMTADYSDSLRKNFDLAKQFIRITKDGNVDILVKEKLTGKEQILLYLVGKMYAKEAGLAATDDVGNNELTEQLGIPIGSLKPRLKELRDKKKIKQIKRERNVYHRVPVTLIEGILKVVEEKAAEKQ